jgi:hypothetical protein
MPTKNEIKAAHQRNWYEFVFPEYDIPAKDRYMFRHEGYPTLQKNKIKYHKTS